VSGVVCCWCCYRGASPPSPLMCHSVLMWCSDGGCRLTHLLQRCFRGDGKTLMLVNLSPTVDSAFESLCSLKFAAQVSQVELGRPARRVVEAAPAAVGAAALHAAAAAGAGVACEDEGDEEVAPAGHFDGTASRASMRSFQGSRSAASLGGLTAADEDEEDGGEAMDDAAIAAACKASSVRSGDLALEDMEAAPAAAVAPVRSSSQAASVGTKRPASAAALPSASAKGSAPKRPGTTANVAAVAVGGISGRPATAGQASAPRRAATAAPSGAASRGPQLPAAKAKLR